MLFKPDTIKLCICLLSIILILLYCSIVIAMRSNFYTLYNDKTTIPKLLCLFRWKQPILSVTQSCYGRQRRKNATIPSNWRTLPTRVRFSHTHSSMQRCTSSSSCCLTARVHLLSWVGMLFIISTWLSCAPVSFHVWTGKT